MNQTQPSKKTKGISHFVKKYIYRKDLIKLSSLYDNAKWGETHRFGQHYQKHFAPFRLKKIKLLEIGVGGYDNPNVGGESLRMWKQYFPNSIIYGIDVVDKKGLEEERIKIFQGDQSDENFLKKVIDETGELDIIIEDGCSVNELRIKTFNTLFPALKEGGIYAEENTHISYWPSLGSQWSKLAENSVFLANCVSVGGNVDLNASDTIMAMYKRLADGLNYEEFLNPGYCPSYLDKNIVSVHFYHNQVIVYKGNNNEGSNIIENNTLKPEFLKALGVKYLEDLGLKFPSMQSLEK
ncbi:MULTISPECIES: hypothetical protein [unclassified Nostoc]|uniref:hypothetical protein n=1 Tax=unclassified Nostoc TaxID=2593658 RepID=UPI0026107BBB|nr:hypothetical protein [Nostoc sp. S13]MDF5735729.1 hypothetical protein [Nostoc sp. S13]